MTREELSEVSEEQDLVPTTGKEPGQHAYNCAAMDARDWVACDCHWKAEEIRRLRSALEETKRERDRWRKACNSPTTTQDYHATLTRAEAAEAQLSQVRADVERLRQQNHDAASKFQKEISTLKSDPLWINAKYEREQRDKVRAFLLKNPDERTKELGPGCHGYSGYEARAVVVAFQMFDQMRAAYEVLEKGLEEIVGYGCTWVCSVTARKTLAEAHALVGICKHGNSLPDPDCGCGV